MHIYIHTYTYIWVFWWMLVLRVYPHLSPNSCLCTHTRFSHPLPAILLCMYIYNSHAPNHIWMREHWTKHMMMIHGLCSVFTRTKSTFVCVPIYTLWSFTCMWVCVCVCVYANPAPSITMFHPNPYWQNFWSYRSS